MNRSLFPIASTLCISTTISLALNTSRSLYSTVAPSPSFALSRKSRRHPSSPHRPSALSALWRSSCTAAQLLPRRLPPVQLLPTPPASAGRCPCSCSPAASHGDRRREESGREVERGEKRLTQGVHVGTMLSQLRCVVPHPVHRSPSQSIVEVYPGSRSIFPNSHRKAAPPHHQPPPLAGVVQPPTAAVPVAVALPRHRRRHRCAKLHLGLHYFPIPVPELRFHHQPEIAVVFAVSSCVEPPPRSTSTCVVAFPGTTVLMCSSATPLPLRIVAGTGFPSRAGSVGPRPRLRCGRESPERRLASIMGSPPPPAVGRRHAPWRPLLVGASSRVVSVVSEVRGCEDKSSEDCSKKQEV
ncbi:uncharacterized protein [Oryza sativa Japonica Group]|uniref:uncharacterized protein n=1 Tax=Oryza sativa subsp. japonica TaxID=39947 RepID=UPI00339BD17F